MTGGPTPTAPAAAADRAERGRPSPALASRLSLPRLSVQPAGEAFIVGDPATATYITVPEVGVVAVRALQAGQTVEEATAAASNFAGEYVDVLDFASVLIQMGLVQAVDGVPVSDQPLAADSSWIEMVPPWMVRPFFSRWAWSIYGLAAAYCLAVFAVWPRYWPSYHDFFFVSDAAVCVGFTLVLRMLLGCVHEVWHWLAARAAGVAARFRVSRRLYYVVFETDLSQLWSVPRSQRYSPFLAGMAFDVLVVAGCLTVRILHHQNLIAIPTGLDRLLAAVILSQVIVIGWQFLVYLRTDIYAVLITALGCTNLYRVNQLTIKRYLRRLSPDEQAELDRAAPRDRRAVRWFSWLSVVGVLWSAYIFTTVFIPSTLIAAFWMFARMGTLRFNTAPFWEALALGMLLTIEVALPVTVFIRERLVRRAATKAGRKEGDLHASASTL